MSSGTTTYQYDSVDRLTVATTKDSSGATLSTYQYTYDNLGNILTKTINGTTTTFTYNAANEITQEGPTNFSYDGNGNETGNSTGLAITYNTGDQATSMTPPGQLAIPMTYSDAGQTKRVRAGTTNYQYDQSGLSVITDVSGIAYFSHFVNGVPLEMRRGGTTYYYLHDARLSVVGLTDSTGNVVNTYQYDPYGNIVSEAEAVANPLKWLGEVFDSATGLYKFGARYYAPDQGRFTQVDPVHFTANYYGYAADDPINLSDQSGLFWCCSWRRFSGWW